MKMDGKALLGKLIEDTPDDVVAELLKNVTESLMGAQVDALCGAARGERSPARVNQRNGYRIRPWDTRAGTIELAIPKLRSGSYFPEWLLERRRRAERALMSVIAESYVLGVSTRRVDKLVKALGVEGISKSQVSKLSESLDEEVKTFRERPLSGAYPFVWLDALEIKCREEGRVVSVAALLAVGVNQEGKREVLGLDTTTTEDGAGWLAFLRGLVARGLGGVRLVTSDAHSGLVKAIRAALPSASWQRCRTHFMRNLLTKVPKKAQSFVATAVRTIFQQPDAAEVGTQFSRVVTQLEGRFPDVADYLAEAREDLLAFTQHPTTVWKQIWSNNPQERLNKEVRRRTDVVGIFPSRFALLRLVGMVLAEQNDEWIEARRYMNLEAVQGTASGSVVADAEAPRRLAAEAV